MSRMPGAVWRPISVPGGLSARTKGRAVILHVAASEATSLFGFFNGNASANSHFYVAKNGTIEQYIDTNYQSWTSMTANKNTIGVETQGGVTNADGEPWTAAQVASLARICAWAHADEGIPLQLMANSLPASKGIGWHRLGIDPWRVAGGEVWSSSRGKVCPGDAKIAQAPTILARAVELAHGSPTPPPTVQEDDMRLVRNKDTGGVYLVGEFDVQHIDQAAWDALTAAGFPNSNVNGAEFNLLLGQITARRENLFADMQRWILGTNPGEDQSTWLMAQVSAINGAVKNLQTGGVDPQTVIAGVLAGLNGAQLNVQQAAGK